MPEPEKKGYFVNSIARCLSIMNSIASSTEGATVSELSKLNKINHTTVIRYLFTLKKIGYIVQDPVSKRYRLTPKILSMGVSAVADLRSRVLPYLVQLREELDVTTHCAMLNGTEIIFVERLRSSDVVNLDVVSGSTLPIYCTASGKAILSALDQNEMHKIVRNIEFVKHTSYTISDRKEFLKEIEISRKRGHAINNQELTLGLKTISVPIFRNGVVEGACGISYSIDKTEDIHAEEVFLKKLKEIAAIVSF